MNRSLRRLRREFGWDGTAHRRVAYGKSFENTGFGAFNVRIIQGAEAIWVGANVVVRLQGSCCEDPTGREPFLQRKIENAHLCEMILSKNNRKNLRLFFGDFLIIISGRKKPPQFKKITMAFGGEGGIRTHGPFRNHWFSRPAP